MYRVSNCETTSPPTTARPSGRRDDPSAPQPSAIGTAPITVDRYQTIAAGKYADKLPGSAYDRSGAAGGYGPTAATGSATPWWLALALVGLLAVGVVAIRRVPRRD